MVRSFLHAAKHVDELLPLCVQNRKGQEFLEMQRDGSPPFFMMLSSPACHEPFPPAPHYAHYYSSSHAPRNHGSFDVKAHVSLCPQSPLRLVMDGEVGVGNFTS